jgi:hypothetical protein
LASSFCRKGTRAHPVRPQAMRRGHRLAASVAPDIFLTKLAVTDRLRALSPSGLSARLVGSTERWRGSMQAARQDERLRPAAAHQADPAADSSDNILSLLARTQQPGRWPSERKPGTEPDWSVALDLVQQAAVAIRVSAERTEAMETRARSLWARATAGNRARAGANWGA